MSAGTPTGWDGGDSLPDAATAAATAPPETDYSAIGAFCHHDPAAMRRLRADLAVIARRTDDPDLRQLCLSALRGQVSVRRVFEHPAFHSMVTTSVDHVIEGIERLDPEQREQLMSRVGANDTSEATEFALMEGRAIPPRGERDPN